MAVEKSEQFYKDEEQIRRERVEAEQREAAALSDYMLEQAQKKISPTVPPERPEIKVDIPGITREEVRTEKEVPIEGMKDLEESLENGLTMIISKKKDEDPADTTSRIEALMEQDKEE